MYVYIASGGAFRGLVWFFSQLFIFARFLCFLYCIRVGRTLFGMVLCYHHVMKHENDMSAVRGN